MNVNPPSYYKQSDIYYEPDFPQETFNFFFVLDKYIAL